MKTKTIYPFLILFLFLSLSLFSQTEGGSPTGYEDDIKNLRNTKNQQMTDAASTPLNAGQIARFKSLNYFPIDIKYKLNAQLVLENPQKEVSLNTTTGDTIKLIKYGTVTFDYRGVSYTLTVFKNNNLPEFGNNDQQLFIPFTDKTTGGKTYENGRYLTIETKGDGNTVVVDFNMAMNPYSGYNSQYSSVIPPAENSMGISMKSGERKFEDRSN